MSANRIPSLDGLRAMAILLVIVGHCWGGPGRSVVLSAFGVQVFFVLSGYLITTLLQKEHAGEGRIDLVAFYRRRCFRIFPAAFTYILLVALLVPESRSGLLYALTYTVSYHYLSVPLAFQHLWSLSVEEQFYLLWPLALVLGYRYRAWIAGSTMVVAAVFRLALALGSSQLAQFYMHFSFPGTMDSIAAGCLLAIYEPQVRERVGWMSESAAIAIAIPITAWTLAGACWGDTQLTAMRSMNALWGVVPLLIALWMFLMIERRDWLFNNPVASTIGVLSYSLYLWQQAFIVGDKHSIPMALLLLSACAVGSYLLIERPMLKLGASIKWHTRRSLTRQIQPAATD